MGDQAVDNPANSLRRSRLSDTRKSCSWEELCSTGLPAECADDDAFPPRPRPLFALFVVLSKRTVASRLRAREIL